MIFYKGAKNAQWGRQSFQQMLLGKLDSHMQKNEFGPMFYTTEKNQLKID